MSRGQGGFLRAAMAGAIRTGICWGVTAAAGAAHAEWGAGQLPQRNLLIEWRTTGEGSAERRQAGIETGRIVVDSRGRVIARTGIGMADAQTATQGESIQQVQVLNGGRAHLFAGTSRPYTVWQWAWGPGGAVGGTMGGVGPVNGAAHVTTAGAAGGVAQAGTSATSAGAGSSRFGALASTGSAAADGSTSGGAAGGGTVAGGPMVWQQTTFIDIGQGLYVRPRWPGGRAPVEVELEARSSQPVQAGTTVGGTYTPDGQTRQLEVASTLSVPLGQWVAVAKTGGRSMQERRSTWSTRDVEEDRAEQIEIRITAP